MRRLGLELIISLVFVLAMFGATLVGKAQHSEPVYVYEPCGGSPGPPHPG
jgi:hypothetical protein